MGDRSWGIFEIPNVPSVLALADKHGFGAEWGSKAPLTTEYPGGVEVVDDESSGGGWSFHEDLIKAGIPYRWRWDACSGAYGGGSGAFVPGIPSVEVGEGIPFDYDTGEPDPSGVANAKEFIRVNKLVPEAIERYVNDHAGEKTV